MIQEEYINNYLDSPILGREKEGLVKSYIPRNEAFVSRSISYYIQIFLELIKFKITILVSFSTGFGYILAAKIISFSIFFPVAGIFLLACSSSVLNHYQERDTDRLMNRTKNRPLPAGKILPQNVLLISFILFIIGSLILVTKTNITTLFIGYLTYIWYNGVYTPLKKITPWAIIPGSIVGALPPLAGWAAANGNLFDLKIFIIAGYFFVWQIPHFWLLLILYADDYKLGGFPTLTDVMKLNQLKKVTFILIVSVVIVALMIPMFGMINFAISKLILLILSLWMFLGAVSFFYSKGDRKPVLNSFLKINVYTLLLIAILSIDKIIKLF